jgi:cytoskeletal protein RodZ
MAVTLGLTLGWLAAGYTPMVWNAQAQPTTLPQTTSQPATESATQPSATQPSATQPSATQPSATQPSATQPDATQPAPPATEPSEGPRVGSAKRFRVIDLGKRAAQLMVARGEQLRLVELALAASLGLLVLAAVVGPWIKASRDSGAKQDAEHKKSGH